MHRVRLGDQALSRGVSLDGANNDVNDSQPRVGSYLAPGARFRTTIQYEGLAIGELCVLLWLLTPERLAPRSAAEKVSGAMGLHRIGYGKPWGMGAIEVRAARHRQGAESRQPDQYPPGRQDDTTRRFEKSSAS